MQSQKTFEKESKTLHDVTLDLTRDIWPDLLHLLTLSATIYFAARPESFVVTAMDIFSLPPDVFLNFFVVAMPLVAAVLFARVATLLMLFVLPFPIAFLFVLLVIPLVIIDKFTFRKNLAGKVSKWLENYKQKRKERKKSPKFLTSNLVIFTCFAIFFFSCYLWNNPISNTWLPSKNLRLVVISYTHYYCQLTGTYHGQECDFWKKELKKYQIKKGLTTPVDCPAYYPKLQDLISKKQN